MVNYEKKVRWVNGVYRVEVVKLTGEENSLMVSMEVVAMFNAISQNTARGIGTKIVDDHIKGELDHSVNGYACSGKTKKYIEKRIF